MMDIYRWLCEEERDLLFLVEEAYRSNEMSEYTDFYVGLFTRMHQAEKERAAFTEMVEFEEMCELEAIQEEWDALQLVPSYVERFNTDVCPSCHTQTLIKHCSGCGERVCVYCGFTEYQQYYCWYCWHNGYEEKVSG
jgi:hypothetical protein